MQVSVTLSSLFYLQLFIYFLYLYISLPNENGQESSVYLNKMYVTATQL